MLYVLASYPKSGNTWLRKLVVSYVMEKNVLINELGSISPSDANLYLWNNVANINTTGNDTLFFSKREILFDKISKSKEFKHIFLKSHVGNFRVNGNVMFPGDLKSVYLVRNPCDVLPSVMSHYNLDFSSALEFMKSENLIIGDGVRQARQIVGSYVSNVFSWSDYNKTLDCRLFRYEDLLKNPRNTLIDVITHFNLEVKPDLINQVISWGAYNQMKKDELENGFVESSEHRPFFESNNSNITNDQRKLITGEFHAVMEKFSYI